MEGKDPKDMEFWGVEPKDIGGEDAEDADIWLECGSEGIEGRGCIYESLSGRARAGCRVVTICWGRGAGGSKARGCWCWIAGVADW